MLSIDYRIPPEQPFPAAVDDVVAVWSSLIKDRDPKSMALGGTSAGGGLILASTHKLIRRGIPVPGALFAGTPWADLTKTGDMFLSNTTRTHRKLRTAGVEADLNVYESLSHGQYLSAIDSPESEQVFAELGAFLLEHLKK